MSGSKLAVVGAGSVGTSLAYAALIRGSASNIALFDINAAKPKRRSLTSPTAPSSQPPLRP
jgi:L-lactate dehydrogenase